MQLETVIEPQRVEFLGKPKGPLFLFITFSLMFIAISAAGAWFTWNSTYHPTPQAEPFMAALFISLPLICIVGLYFALRRDFRSMRIDAAKGVIDITWMHLFGDRIEQIALSDVREFAIRFLPQSNRSRGWLVELRLKNGIVIDTGKFDDEAPTKAAVEAANALLTK